MQNQNIDCCNDCVVYNSVVADFNKHSTAEKKDAKMMSEKKKNNQIQAFMMVLHLIISF